MNRLKAWHVIAVAVLCAGVGAAAVGLYYKHEQSVQAAALPNAARIQRVDGEVGLNNTLTANNNAANPANTDWQTASVNQPFTVGHRLYTRDRSRASLAFNGRNFARLDPNTELDAITLTDDRTQLALRDGSAIFDVGYLAPGELFEVGTPYGAVDFNQPGLYNVGIDNGNAMVSVLSGVAQVVGLGSNGQISKGQMFTLLGAAAADVALSRLDSRNAGYMVDDYYRYQYPNAYDGRYANYDAYLNDPNYFDPYRRNVSYKYVTYEIPGVDDLDYYGDWQNVNGYGNVWHPRVDTAWAPYQDGYWANDYPYGPTWVSSEAWGYAPYHYGRWIDVNNQWFWVPEAVNTTPRYAPALVAFVPFQNDQIGWVPLGPSDPYVARYYNDNWQPVYLNRGSIAPTSLANLNVPGAVTVVPIANFGNTINPRTVTRVDPRALAQVRSTLDPLTVSPLRNAVMHSAWGRGKMDLPPGIAKKLDDTHVVMGTTPLAPPFRKDLARNLRVDAAPARNQNFGRREEQRNVTAQAPPQTSEPAARQQQIEQLRAEAVRGNRDAQRQASQLEQQQRRDQLDQQRAQVAQQRQQAQQQRTQAQQARVQEREQRRAVQQAQGVRVGQPARQAEASRQQVQRSRPQPLPRVAAQPQPARQAERKTAPPQIRQEQRAQERIQRRPPPQPQAERVANPVRQAPATRPQAQRPQPQQRSAAPQPVRPQAAKSQAPPGQERKQQGPPPSQGGGKGKGKKP